MVRELAMLIFTQRSVASRQVRPQRALSMDGKE